MCLLKAVNSADTVQSSSVAQTCQLCNPMNRSTSGLPVHHQLPVLTQTHVHQVSDAIQHLILCHPLLFLPPIPPSIRVFSNESNLRMRWPEYWSFSFSLSPSSEHPGVCHNSSESPREAQTYIHVLASRQAQLIALDSSLSASADINQHLTGMDWRGLADIQQDYTGNIWVISGKRVLQDVEGPRAKRP